MLSRMSHQGLLWPAIVSLAGIAILLSLGTWQLRRLAWKEALIAAVEQRASEAPLAHDEALRLRCDMADMDIAHSCEFRRLHLRGKFENANERHIFAGVVGKGGQASVGYWVFTPFIIDGAASGKGGGRILVNRGFVPEALKDPARRPKGQIEGPTEITAQLRTRELRGTFSGADDEQRNIYYVRDPRELGQPYDAPVPQAAIDAGWFYLEEIGNPPDGGYPQPLAGKPEFPNRHLEYALTWYGLAATLLGVFLAFVWSRSRQRG